MYKDKTLVCRDCGNNFTFTAGEQQFYAERDSQTNRSAAKHAATPKGGKPARQMFDAVCSDCGKECKIPFEPKTDRPVYCSDCFGK